MRADCCENAEAGQERIPSGEKKLRSEKKEKVEANGSADT